MASGGKGGKAASGKMGGRGGKMGGKARPRIVDIDNWQGITNPAIRRLLRKGGVLRAKSEIYGEARDVIKSFLTMILGDAIVYTDHARRKTISALDIKHSLDHNKIKYYSCGTDKKTKD